MRNEVHRAQSISIKNDICPLGHLYQRTMRQGGRLLGEGRSWLRQISVQVRSRLRATFDRLCGCLLFCDCFAPKATGTGSRARRLVFDGTPVIRIKSSISSGVRLSFNNRLIGIVPPSADANKTRPLLIALDLRSRPENYGKNPDPS